MSAVGARIEAPKAPRRVEFGEGCPPSNLGKGLEKSAALPENHFHFESQNVDF